MFKIAYFNGLATADHLMYKSVCNSQNPWSVLIIKHVCNINSLKHESFYIYIQNMQAVCKNSVATKVHYSELVA